jgi:hypothetical protein
MNSWLVWGGFALAVVFLGWVAYHFTVRTLRSGLRRVPDLPGFMRYAVVGRYLRRL